MTLASTRNGPRDAASIPRAMDTERVSLPMTKPECSGNPGQPEDRSPEQIAADRDWLRTIRAETSKRWGGVVGGHDAFLDTLDTSDPIEAVA
jgi:hypothetical protein